MPYPAAAEQCAEGQPCGLRAVQRDGGAVGGELGQLLDYSRYVEHSARAVLVPSRPAEDLCDLLLSHSISFIYQVGRDFRRNDPTR